MSKRLFILGEGKMFAKQTETDLSHKRSFASLKMTSAGHSEQREEFHKLDCFARFADGGNWARNDGNEVFPRPLRERVRVRGNDSAIADRASLVRNDGNPPQPSLVKGGSVRNDETPLVPQYLSALVPSKKAAFTLAEVLITLGIIGVVAAMTMPTLIANYQKNRAITQLKKAYSELSQAVRLSEAYNGETKEWNYNLSAKDFYEAYLKNYLKSIQELSYGDYNVKYINLDNSNCEEAWCNQAESYYVMLADGAVIAVSSWIDNGDDTKYKAITIDINGKKGPNKSGIDYFAYTIQERGLVPYGVGYYVGSENAFGADNNDRDKMTGNSRKSCSSTGTGTFCSALILHDNWQIKYDYK